VQISASGHTYESSRGNEMKMIVPGMMALVILILTLLNPPPATACSCVEPNVPTDALAKATAVFSGIVVSMDYQYSGTVQSSADPVTVILKVGEVWKDPEEAFLSISTAVSSVSCGYEFQVGKWYLVYASGPEDHLKVGLCSRTKLQVLADEDFEALGQGKRMVQVETRDDISQAPIQNQNPSAEEGFDYIPIITFVAGVPVGVLVLALVKRRRRERL